MLFQTRSPRREDGEHVQEVAAVTHPRGKNRGITAQTCENKRDEENKHVTRVINMAFTSYRSQHVGDQEGVNNLENI